MLRHCYGPVGLALVFLGLIHCAPAGAATAAELPAKAPLPRVDFSYAFATPHRLTVGRPDSSDRTLLDLQPGWLRMAWTYEDLTHYPLAAFVTPATAWDIHITPQLDGKALAKSRWTRLDGFLPALDNSYEDPLATVRLKVLGGMTAALVRVEVVNRDQHPHQVVVRCESANWGENRGWVEPAHGDCDVLLAGWRDRADRVLLLGLGADAYSLTVDRRAPGPKTIALVWHLKPGQRCTGWLVRPYRAYLADVPTLRSRDWTGEWEDAKKEWLTLLDQASRVSIPDEGVSNALRACLADLFIMREPVAGGQIAAVPGTEVYRAPNAFEAAIVAVALDQMGFHELSAAGYRMCLQMQEPDGDWNDPQGWGHLMWGGAGFKAWAAMEHYRLTKDRKYLEWVYPRLAASSRWQEQQRVRMRSGSGVDRPVTYGLMPPGMGDAGLMNDGDLYGVFLPHNIWAVYADRLSIEAAKILGRTADLEELERIYRTGRNDLLEAIRRGTIQADGYRWIPGVPGKTSGSRWGVLNALTPCGLLPPDHELISGTLRQIESRLSPGGVPIHTGWMADGMWVAITLDNVAEAHLARGNGDAAARYLYATLNHATPLYTWCEERGQEPGTTKCSGDRQHLWTPVAVVRAIRDSMVMEQGDGLQLGLGTDRSWLASGKPVGIADAPTHFGRVSWNLQYDAAKAQVSCQAQFPENPSAAWAEIQVRLPGSLRVTAIEAESGAELLPDGRGVRWKAPRGKMKFTAGVTAIVAGGATAVKAAGDPVQTAPQPPPRTPRPAPPPEPAANSSEFPPPSPVKDASQFGQGVQRTMTLLATSTPQHRNHVRVVFYGQSITEQEWSKQVAGDLRRRFPYADLEIENRAIGGFASQMLIHPAEHDIYPFYSDLVIFHVFGANQQYEQIIRSIRSRTTAEVLMQTDRVGDKWPQEQPDEKADKGLWWDYLMNHRFLPEIAGKYGCGLCDIRAGWLAYLRANHYEPSRLLLKDGAHLNVQGNYLMAQLTNRYLVYRPDLSDAAWKGLTATYPIGPGVWKDGKLVIAFEGNRVDLIPVAFGAKGFPPAGGSGRVLIDGRRPSSFPDAYCITRPQPGPWSPLFLSRVDHDAPLVLEDWTLKVSHVSADGKTWDFDVTGSVTGPDGSGHSDRPFTSKSGRVKIEPAAWFRGFYPPLPDGYTVRWKVLPMFADTYRAAKVAKAADENATTVVQGIANAKHTLEIIADDPASPPAIASARTYRPSVKAE